MSSKIKVAIFLETCTAIGLAVFWFAFFAVGIAPKPTPPGYYFYENSFPLPDGILATALLAAAHQLYRGKALGKSLSLVCGGALLFLGVLDFSFNVQNGMYKISTNDTIGNAFINAWCVFFGLWLAISFRIKN